jgi:hypothetical protein
MQHTGTENRGAEALGRLGIPYPIVDPDLAWETIKRRMIDALIAIREEIQSGHPLQWILYQESWCFTPSVMDTPYFATSANNPSVAARSSSRCPLVFTGNTRAAAGAGGVVGLHVGGGDGVRVERVHVIDDANTRHTPRNGASSAVTEAAA